MRATLGAKNLWTVEQVTAAAVEAAEELPA
jgi:hypothetical protein